MPSLLKPSLRVAVCEYHDRFVLLTAKKTRWTWQLEEAVLSKQGFPVSPRYSCRWMRAPCAASTCFTHVWPFVVSHRMNILKQATWNWKQYCILLLRGGKECFAVENSENIMSGSSESGQLEIRCSSLCCVTALGSCVQKQEQESCFVWGTLVFLLDMNSDSLSCV